MNVEHSSFIVPSSDVWKGELDSYKHGPCTEDDTDMAESFATYGSRLWLKEKAAAVFRVLQ